MSGITNNTTVNVAISGVGGQGVLTLAEILARAAMLDGHNVRVGEIHGMAQRGGHVVCTVRIGDQVKGPIIDSGEAHLIVGFEPLELLREIHLIRNNGLVIMNSHVQYPVAVSMGEAEYPKEEDIRKFLGDFTSNILELDAMELAVSAGSSISMNIVMLGAIIGSNITPIRKTTALQVIRDSFSKKYEEANIRAFESGYKLFMQT
ncbi:MAG: indolepyruvate oxidoreductase subunit beta [Candidatus Thorarchaeota archaeon]